MSPHDRNEICVEQIGRLRKDVDKHLDEAPKFRDMSIKHESQILTLEKAQASTMEDISQIKNTLIDMKTDFNALNASVKSWVLSGVISTILIFAIPTFTLFYTAGKMTNQIESNTKRLEKDK